MKIYFDRSSVCMGDDCENHAEEFETDSNLLISKFISLYILNRLPSIGGGKATWVLRIKVGTSKYKDVAVIAQQWSNAKLLYADYVLNDLASNNELIEFFALYRCQEDPTYVYNILKKK